MTPQQIEAIKSLDPEGKDGTIQSVLLRKDLNTVPYQATLEFLLKATVGFKNQLQQENRLLTKILKDNGLYTSENLFP